MNSPSSTTPSFVPTVAERVLLRALVSDLARRAGALAVSQRSLSLQIMERKTTEFDVATAVDVACEELLRREIAQARPRDGILGEEGEMTVGTSGLTWVIDPIDGTTNYLYGLPQWGVSVAIVAGPPDNPHAWRPIAGSIYQPDADLQYDAALGLGVQRNGKDLTPLRSGTPGRITELRAALVSVGFHYLPDARSEQAAIAASLAGRVRDLRDHGATSIELCHVAAGEVDGYWEERLAPWDVAAGLLIAAEAGCTIRWVTRATRTETLEALIVCGTSALADALSEVLPATVAP